MKHCCEDKDQEISALKVKQSKALKIVFLINFLMFFVEFVSGIKAHSTALMGDSLDMLGDAFVYGFSLFVLYKSIFMKARAAQLKGWIMVLFGLGVLAEAIRKIVYNVTPIAETMGLIGTIALLANLFCLWILYSHREDDINMSSTWTCSRNDIIANAGTLIAALFVNEFQSVWPDVFVGGIIAVLFLTSAFSILKESALILRKVD